MGAKNEKHFTMNLPLNTFDEQSVASFHSCLDTVPGQPCCGNSRACGLSNTLCRPKWHQQLLKRHKIIFKFKNWKEQTPYLDGTRLRTVIKGEEHENGHKGNLHG